MEPGISISQIFLESAHFEHRPDFLNLPPNTPAQVGTVAIRVSVGTTKDEQGGIVRASVATKPEENPIYKASVSMIALVARTPGDENITIPKFIESPAAISVIYPFLREAFANLTGRGRFGPVWLSAINPMTISGALKEARQAAPGTEFPPQSADPAPAPSVIETPASGETARVAATRIVRKK